MPDMRYSSRLVALLVAALLGLAAEWLAPPASARPPQQRPRSAQQQQQQLPTGEPLPPGTHPPRPNAPRVVARPHQARLRPTRWHILVQFRDRVPRWQRALRAQQLGAAAYRPARAADFARVVVPAGSSVDQLLASFRADPDVAWAERDYRCRALAFNDPLLARQWSYDRIHLLPALDRNGTLGQGAVVAVIDTGVAYGNGGSFPAKRGLDLDGTSFTPGWDFVDDDAQPYDEGSAFDPDNPTITPRFGHGTFAAAQIAATAGNGVAGIGVAPRATIMPLRVLGIDGTGFFSDVADAITYATDHGAQVINLSLGGDSAPDVLQQAIQQAHDAGVVIVAAAGNEHENADFSGDVAYPARYPR